MNIVVHIFNSHDYEKNFTHECCLVYVFVSLLASCSVDDDRFAGMDPAAKSHFKSEIRHIKESGIPEGIIPLVLESEAELDGLLKWLDNVKPNAVNEADARRPRMSLLKTRSEGPDSYSHLSTFDFLG